MHTLVNLIIFLSQKQCDLHFHLLLLNVGMLNVPFRTKDLSGNEERQVMKLEFVSSSGSNKEPRPGLKGGRLLLQKMQKKTSEFSLIG